MDTGDLDWQNRTTAMQTELASMTYVQCIGWGGSRFGGQAFDNMYGRLSRNPDGTPSDPVVETDRVGNWVAYFAAFVAILAAKA